jgi:hypothetical protein
MSTNLSPEQYLTALVLAAPRKKPYGDTEDMRPYCALMRANVARGNHHYNLIAFAVELGFSRAQARGIMRGWDMADGRRPGLEENAAAWPRETAAGEKIGRRLHALVRAVSTAETSDQVLVR